MRKITAFVGSARKKHTYQAVQGFLDHLESLGDVETEIVALGDYRLEICRGCKVCFEKGEAFCPHKDDQQILVEKMTASDGVILASPNYAFQISGLTKVFLDRLAYLLHRPCFFGKAFTSIVTQGVYGGNKIVKYLDFVGSGLGFNTVKGSCITALEPMTAKEAAKVERGLVRHSQRFYECLTKVDYPAPTLFKLMTFRMGRTSMRLELDDTSYDYRYYRDRGWFESDYFYPTRLGMGKRLVGQLFDTVAARMAKHRG
jgi:multimeric flavodoxin WrbA